MQSTVVERNNKHGDDYDYQMVEMVSNIRIIQK